VTGPNLADDRAFADKVRNALHRMPQLRTCSSDKTLDYPTVNVNVDRGTRRLDRESAWRMSRARW